jgi:ABC-2 type transport system ATP-binding protein
VILDEPTAGMDVESRAATRSLLGRLRDEGVTILLTSHDLADVERLADRIAILDRGRIVAVGGPEELGLAASSEVRFRLPVALTEPDRRELETRLAEGRPRVSLMEDGGPGRYRLEGTAPAPDLVAALAAWCASRGGLILELRTGGGSLEERYLDLIGSLRDDEEPE